MVTLIALIVATTFLVFQHGLTPFFPLLFTAQLLWRFGLKGKGKLFPWVDILTAVLVVAELVLAGLEGTWDSTTKYGMVVILVLTGTSLLGAAVAFVDGVRLMKLPAKFKPVLLASLLAVAVLGWLGWDFFLHRPADPQMDLAGAATTVPVAASATDSDNWAEATLAPSLLQLGPALGNPGPDSIRIWAAAANDLALQAVVFETGKEVGRFPLGITSAANGTGFAQVTGLKPQTAYTYDVVGTDGKSVVSADLLPYCQFHTFPAAGQTGVTLRYALTSCHRPLEETDDYYSGKIINERFVMWETLVRQNRETPYDFVLMLGDQLYNDIAYKKSLAANDDATTRALYRDNYLKYWSHPSYRKMMASIPSFMMEDDHDTRDGWGSEYTDADAPAQKVHAQAAALYQSFQGWSDPQPFAGKPYFAFDYGNLGFFIPDLRSFRDVNRPAAELPLLGKQQTEDLKAWFASRSDTKTALFFGLSIPIANAPQWVIDWLVHNGNGLGDDFRDAWVSPGNRPELASFLDQGFSWMKKTGGRVFTMGGDTHTAMLGRITPASEPNAVPIVEFSSSGVSNFDSTAQGSWSLFNEFAGQNQQNY